MTTQPDDHSSTPASDLVTVRAPSSGPLAVDFHELWRFRELLQLLVWRNTVVRYKQSVAGIAWALIKPVVTMVVFSLVFGRFAGLPSEDKPYPIFTYVALLPWLYFAGSLGSAGGSLVSGASLLKKVYVPRLILPLSYLFTGLIDFLISFLVLIGMMLFYHDFVRVTWGVVCLPLFLFMAMLTAFSFALWLSAMMVKYRDVQHVLPFLTQIWLYLTPVAYSASLVSEKFRLVYALNPMYGVVTGFRWALLGTSPPDPWNIVASVGIILLVLIGGLSFFKRTERTVVDII